MKTKLFNSSFFKSIQTKIIVGLIVIVLPLLIYLIYNNLNSISIVRNQVTQSNINLLHLYMGLIDKDLESIDNYLFQVSSFNMGLNYLSRPSTEDIDLYTLAKYQLFREMYDNNSSYHSLESFLFYSIPNQDLVIAPNDTLSNSEKISQFQSDLKHIFTSSERISNYPFDSWVTVKLSGEAYLIHIIKSGNVYIGAIVNIKTQMKSLDLLDLGAKGQALLVDSQKAPLQNESQIIENHINLDYVPNTYQLTGKKNEYLVIGEQSEKGDFSIITILHDDDILENLPHNQKIIMMINSGLVIIVIIAFFFLRKVIVAPIKRIILAMRKIHNGHMSTRIVDLPTSYEFQILNENFNRMISEIENLKINIYEEQIISKQAELKYYQLQVNPHFYLNSLNIIYYLAEDENYPLIQDLSMSLIEYFRFMFRSYSDFVLLQDEIQHIHNYMRIQQFRFVGNLHYRVVVPEHLTHCYVPPLIIQTFVENSIKYAINMDEPIEIIILVEDIATSSNGQMKLQIRDTGKGFSDEILSQLQNKIKPNVTSGGHIGIWNVMSRLSLLYHGKANISFCNDHGAVIEIELPIEREKE
ncbi:sensor histidine kinase [Paenibacillus endoradicis]|uniref:sensor histidine kinase n=1 Tax=Paenibacillus endoradicis TaxID=2972487 RepID=UPI0021596C88|nr:histidine kinase [Paenibacillus endoradicis]MCR8657690.1 histidine kinase [Paenibacillus endoradicis]